MAILPPVAHPQRWRDALFELKLDALGRNKVEQPFPVLPNISGYALGKLGKVFALGLGDIEHIGGTETTSSTAFTSARVFLKSWR